MRKDSEGRKKKIEGNKCGEREERKEKMNKILGIWNDRRYTNFNKVQIQINQEEKEAQRHRDGQNKIDNEINKDTGRERGRCVEEHGRRRNKKKTKKGICRG